MDISCYLDISSAISLVHIIIKSIAFIYKMVINLKQRLYFYTLNSIHFDMNSILIYS